MCVCVGLMVSLVSCLVIVRSLQLVSILCIVLAQVLMMYPATPPRAQGGETAGARTSCAEPLAAEWCWCSEGPGVVVTCDLRPLLICLPLQTLNDHPVSCEVLLVVFP